MPKDNPESIAKAEASARRALVRAEAAAARQKDEEEMQAFLRACPTLDDIDVNALDQHEVTVFEKILASQHYEEKLLKLNKTRERVHAAAKRRLQTTLERVRCMEAAVSGLVGVVCISTMS